MQNLIDNSLLRDELNSLQRDIEKNGLTPENMRRFEQLFNGCKGDCFGELNPTVESYDEIGPIDPQARLFWMHFSRMNLNQQVGNYDHES